MMPDSVGESWTTYELADGDLIMGEFGWVTDTDFFDDLDDQVEVIRREWKLVKVDRVMFGPPPLTEEEANE